MKTPFILLSLAIAIACSAATPEREQKIPKAALEFWLREKGLLAEERIEIGQEFVAPRSITGFAEAGDRIVEIRIVHLSNAPSGVLWLNEKTGAIQALGLNQK